MRFRIFLALAALGVSTGASAGDDPSIQGDLRQQIQAAMNTYVDARSVEGVMSHYDPIDGKLLRLELDELHSGIVKKGDFYVSCADFRDQDGRKIDVDFLVVEAGGQLKATQGVVHSVEGKKRPYHLE